MFLMLGLLVFPSRLDEVAVDGTAIALVLVLVARPLATVVSLLPFSFSAREQAAIAWAGLRGAVPVVLATFPIIEGVTGSLEVFDVVFFAVLVSTVLQGASFEWIARKLGVTSDEPALPRPLAESGTIRGLGAQVLEFPVAPDDADRRRARAGARPSARRARQRDRAPRRGGAAARHDGARGGRRAARAGPRLGGRPDRRTSWSAGATARSSALGASVRSCARAARSSRPARGRRPTATRRGRRRSPAPGSWRRCAFATIEPGSLVALDDGRFALAGEILAIGSRERLAEWIRRRLRRTRDEDEREWLRDALGALAF